MYDYHDNIVVKKPTTRSVDPPDTYDGTGYHDSDSEIEESPPNFEKRMEDIQRASAIWILKIRECNKQWRIQRGIQGCTGTPLWAAPSTKKYVRLNGTPFLATELRKRLLWLTLECFRRNLLENRSIGLVVGLKNDRNGHGLVQKWAWLLKYACASRATVNQNPPFRNPGSATDKLTQVATESIIKDVDSLYQVALDNIQCAVEGALKEAGIMPDQMPALKTILSSTGPYGKLFSGLETHHRQLAYMRSHFKLVVGVK